MWTSRPSTTITELLPAFTSHTRTSLRSLDPIVAFGTLLESSSSHELNKLFVIFVETIIDSILGTGHSMMIFTFTLQAIVFGADRTLIII